MKIAIITINPGFLGPIMEEFERHHEVKLYQRTNDVSTNRVNLLYLTQWADLVYAEFIQNPLPWYSGQSWAADTTIVARMDGIDLLNHENVNWENINGLIIQPVQRKRLKTLRRRMQLQPLPDFPILETYLGVDLETFKLQPSSRQPGHNIVIHAATIRSTKGVYAALQAFKDLITLDPVNPWKLTIIGQWVPSHTEYNMMLHELVETLEIPATQIEVISKNLPKEKWVKLLQSQDLYWCFSKRESFGKSMAEAAASGVFPFMNHFYGAELLYGWMHLAATPRILVDTTLQWEALPAEDKIKQRVRTRDHVELTFDSKEAVTAIREFCEMIHANRH